MIWTPFMIKALIISLGTLVMIITIRVNYKEE